MKTSKNTVLITGGSAGIGFEIAKIFSENDNHVIIVGRNEARLQQAAAQLKSVTAIAADISKDEDIEQLVNRLKIDFPQLNILINNAGAAQTYQLGPQAGASVIAANEMQTNYISVLNLTEKLLPLLENKDEAAIVNVTSIVAFVPGHSIPTYSASKAALHSYTQSLRHTYRNSSIKVFELMPPLVNTEFSKEIGGENGIPASQVAAELIQAFGSDHYEIHVGGTSDMYKLFHHSPADAFAAMNPTA
jgi:uncharacterized oxidoreductase